MSGFITFILVLIVQKYNTDADMLRQATLRVTNVSTDATRDDMHELFRKFGPIARVSVPQVRNTYTHTDAQVRLL